MAPLNPLNQRLLAGKRVKELFQVQKLDLQKESPRTSARVIFASKAHLLNRRGPYRHLEGFGVQLRYRNSRRIKEQEQGEVVHRCAGAFHGFREVISPADRYLKGKRILVMNPPRTYDTIET